MSIEGDVLQGGSGLNNIKMDFGLNDKLQLPRCSKADFETNFKKR